MDLLPKKLFVTGGRLKLDGVILKALQKRHVKYPSNKMGDFSEPMTIRIPSRLKPDD